MPRLLLLVSCLLGLSATAALADGPAITTPDKVQWSGEGLPAGVTAAVVAGDPSKSAPYVMRVKLAPNASFPLHSHPDTENVTVLKGTFGITFDPKGDRSKGRKLPAGSFVSIPANTAHLAWSGASETIVQVHGIGPSSTKVIGAAK